MRSLLVVSFVALLLPVAAATPAWAATIKVPGDFADPQAAVAAAGPGDTIVILGDHTGMLTIAAKTDLKIKGKKGATLDADGADHALEIDNCSDLVISGLEFTNSASHGVTIQFCNEIKITKCSVTDVSGHGIAIGSSDEITVEKSKFSDCGVDGINFDVDLTGTPPSACRFVKNSVERCDDDGIDGTGDGHVIEKNRVENIQNIGIIIDDSADSSDVTISKNKVEDTGEQGIMTYGNEHTIVKNKITDAGDDGIRVMGDDSTCSKNKTSGSGDDGIDVEGQYNEVTKNKISGPEGDGFDVDGDNNDFIGNKVTGAGDDGMEVEADGNTVDKNQFLKNDDHGIVVQEGAGNSFDKNKVLKNDDDDIWTDVPVGDNTWGKNKYKTGNIEP